MNAPLEVTRLVSAAGVLTKRITLGEDGRLVSDGSACVMGRGSARRAPLQTVQAFADLIGGLGSNEAIALGALRADLPDQVQVTTAKKLSELNGSAGLGTIARTAGHIVYTQKRTAFALLDYDTKGMPKTVADRIKALGGFWDAIVSVVPELAQGARVIRPSTSAGISRKDTGELIPGSDGRHIFVLVEDGSDIERFLRTLHDRCWLHGLGWMMVGAGGQLLERSIVDRMVYAAERLVFEGAPVLVEPLRQDPALREPIVTEGDALDTVAACRSLTIVERATLQDLKSEERHRLAGQAGTVRNAFVKERAGQLAQKLGISITRATRTIEQYRNGILHPGVELPFDAEEFAGATVGDVLDNPERFAGATMADPLEGLAYGRCKAKILQRDDGWPWINSFAHGRATYELKYDAAAVEKKLRAAEAADVADLFVRLLVRADIPADEEQALRLLVSELTGIKAQPLRAKVKQAKAEHSQQRSEQRKEHARATKKDRRLRLPAPNPDQERLPILEALDEVLSNVAEPEPPMRDLEGQPTEVRERSPSLMHELNAAGSNQEETKTHRLPAPTMPLLSAHDRYSFAHTVERYIEFFVEMKEGERSVALSPTFIDHYIAYRDSSLPTVSGIVTAPLVGPSGAMLAPHGLDRDRKLVFRIPRELRKILPSPDDAKPTAQQVAAALDFLCNDWLCDVATDFAGKCVLISLALTIIERVLLPERPAFFVTAGKRGGGKTTALAMIILAVTGLKPAAAAWSFSEDERRKALLAYLAQGLAAMVFDNIPLGSTIACPTIEKVLTAETYSDRVLGQTSISTVPAFTILTLTGNNIAPKGDLASRSLIARLNVDRPDPENRPFRHSDPIAWTIDQRGKILRALYVILLGNQQLTKPQAPKTRFKRWWHLVGSTVENAAAGLVVAEANKPEAERSAEVVDFSALFAAVEGEDEEGAALGDVLMILDAKFNGRQFQASEVGELAAADGPEAEMLCEFFEPKRKGSGPPSARGIGKRLSAVVGTPIPAGDHVLVLTLVDEEHRAAGKRAARFRVRRV